MHVIFNPTSYSRVGSLHVPDSPYSPLDPTLSTLLSLPPLLPPPPSPFPFPPPTSGDPGSEASLSPHTVNPCACVGMDCNEIVFFISQSVVESGMHTLVPASMTRQVRTNALCISIVCGMYHLQSHGNSGGTCIIMYPKSGSTCEAGIGHVAYGCVSEDTRMLNIPLAS